MRPSPTRDGRAVHCAAAVPWILAVIMAVSMLPRAARGEVDPFVGMYTAGMLREGILVGAATMETRDGDPEHWSPFTYGYYADYEEARGGRLVSAGIISSTEFGAQRGGVGLMQLRDDSKERTYLGVVSTFSLFFSLRLGLFAKVQGAEGGDEVMGILRIGVEPVTL